MLRIRDILVWIRIQHLGWIPIRIQSGSVPRSNGIRIKGVQKHLDSQHWFLSYVLYSFVYQKMHSESGTWFRTTNQINSTHLRLNFDCIQLWSSCAFYPAIQSIFCHLISGSQEGWHGHPGEGLSQGQGLGHDGSFFAYRLQRSTQQSSCEGNYFTVVLHDQRKLGRQILFQALKENLSDIDFQYWKNSQSFLFQKQQLFEFLIVYCRCFSSLEVHYLLLLLFPYLLSASHFLILTNLRSVADGGWSTG